MKKIFILFLGIGVHILQGCSEKEHVPDFAYEVGMDDGSANCLTIDFALNLPLLAKNALGAHHGMDNERPSDDILLPQRPKMDRDYQIFQRHIDLNLRVHLEGAIGSEFDDMITNDISVEDWKDIYRRKALIVKESPIKENIYFDIVNEPNCRIVRNGSGAGYLPWEIFFPMWKNAFEAIKETDPEIKIAGPSIDESAFKGGMPVFEKQMSDFLDYCKDNNCIPDLITFHSETYYGPTNPLKLTKKIKHLLDEKGITSVKGFSCNEFAIAVHDIPRPCSPGIFFRYLPLFEDAQLMDAALSGDSRTFGNATNKDQQIIALWHARKAYVDMPAQRVAIKAMVNEPGREEEMDGLASWQENLKLGTVLLGNAFANYPSNQYRIRLENLPESLGKYLHLKILKLPYTISGKNDPLERPVRVLENNYQIPESRALDLALEVLPHEGFIIKITEAY